MIDRWGKLAVSLYGIAIARKGLFTKHEKADGTVVECSLGRVGTFEFLCPPRSPVAAAYLTVWAWMVARQAKHFKLTDVNDTFQSSEHILCAYMDGGRELRFSVDSVLYEDPGFGYELKKVGFVGDRHGMKPLPKHRMIIDFPALPAAPFPRVKKQREGRHAT
ncbi:hypothetical protein CISG_01319 [Coccidioides immitis RMSCC 3703]|uniref:Uncharacterized protein n=1 Tax=Coccidioides immitis RMSCC 3703 TaxID=454286 RepID=A0A0J8QYL8_COCIT|nr:hypothetical protein CISG_01319 [Coccidioides immitis RMSCC 3703]